MAQRRFAIFVITAGISLSGVGLSNAPFIPVVISGAIAQPAPAAVQIPAPVVVMVDMQQLIYGSKAGKGVQAELEQRREAFSKEVAAQEDQIHKAQSELDRQRSVLAPDAMDAQNRELQRQIEALDRVVKSTEQTWQQGHTDAMNKVEDEALRVVAEIAAERGANLVLQKAAVIFSKDGFDITADALTRLDQRLPAVTLNLPQPSDGTTMTDSASSGKAPVSGSVGLPSKSH